MRLSKRQVIASGIAAALWPAAVRAQKSGADVGPLQRAMAEGRFVTYQPTALRAVNGVLTPASDASIRDDLLVLRPYFDSLITYGALAGNERVPDVAHALGFRTVVMGVWDIHDRRAIGNAIAAWKRNPTAVAGISLGNEVMLGKRGAWADIAGALDRVRAIEAGIPLTTTESFAQFLDDPTASAVLTRIDFMLVNIHPIFETWFKSAPAFNRADFVMRVTRRLEALYAGPILIKETGIPTDPASMGYNEDMQSAFYRALEKQFAPSARRAFSYFSAFDAPWRVNDFTPTPGTHAEEAHWGIFTADRRPKKIIAGIPPFSRKVPG